MPLAQTELDEVADHPVVDAAILREEVEIVRGEPAELDMLPKFQAWSASTRSMSLSPPPLDGARTRALCQTFSELLVLPPDERERVLDRIVAVIEEQFGGLFGRTAGTIVYSAQRR